MKRILAVKLADIGDALTITPALRAVRRSFPEAQVTALVTENGRAVLERTDLVDDLVVFDQHRFDAPGGAVRPSSVLAALRLARELRARRFDTLVLFHHLTTAWGSLKYAALALGCGAPRRVGLQPVGPDRRACSRRAWFLNLRVPDAGFGARHEVDHWLALAGALGATTEAPRIEFPLLPEDIDWAAALPLALAGAPVVALYPGSGGYSLARRWPADRFIAVGRGLQAVCGAGIVVIGGREEGELAGRVAAGIPGAISLAGATTLGQLGALLWRCALLVGNDGGPMHVAAGVGTPAVAVFGPSNPLAWGPYLPADRVRIVRAELPCRPCLYVGHRLGKRTGCARMTCMEMVTPEMVLQAAGELLPACSPGGNGDAGSGPGRRGEPLASSRRDENGHRPGQ